MPRVKMSCDLCENLAAFCLSLLDMFAIVLGSFASSGYAFGYEYGGYDYGKLHDALFCLLFDL